MNARAQGSLAGDRVRTFLTLVPYLLERGEVTLAEAAQEFGVTETAMRAMVEKLTVIGLPGDSGHWQQPHELFDINWDLLDSRGIIEITNDVALRRVPRFSAQEASALLAGLQLVAALPGVSNDENLAALTAKLSRASVSSRADVVIVPTEIDEVRRAVSEALRREVAVSFAYRAPDARPTTRTVDPWRVLVTNGQWYLQGWCHLRQAERTFHLERVAEVTVTETPTVHPPLGGKEPFSGDPSDQQVTVRMPRAVAPLFAVDLGAEIADEDDDVVEFTFSLADVRQVKRLAGRAGGQITVIEPAAARTATAEWAAAGLALYKSA